MLVSSRPLPHTCVGHSSTWSHLSVHCPQLLIFCSKRPETTVKGSRGEVVNGLFPWAMSAAVDVWGVLSLFRPRFLSPLPFHHAVACDSASILPSGDVQEPSTWFQQLPTSCTQAPSGLFILREPKSVLCKLCMAGTFMIDKSYHEINPKFPIDLFTVMSKYIHDLKFIPLFHLKIFINFPAEQETSIWYFKNATF